MVSESGRVRYEDAVDLKLFIQNHIHFKKSWKTEVT